LLLANLVGLMLAALLLWPQLNRVLQPFTYGRWMPLHLDWQLYGWCSLPLLGLLCSRFLDHDKQGGRTTILCFSLWTVGLLFGGVRWLSGDVSGKIFLNWVGLSGIVFALAQLGIWSFLATGWYQRFKRRKAIDETNTSLTAKAIVLLALLCVPLILVRTSDANVYPPINPESGGATGHSLLLSTLSLVFLMGLLPGTVLKLQGLNKQKRFRSSLLFWGIFGVSMIVYFSMDHGNASNRTFNQVLGLGTLLVWPILIHRLWTEYAWQKSSQLWRWAFIFWWMLLAVDGWGIFLPGVLETVKFTNVLVGHSHLAMAGMVSALNVIILIEMGNIVTIQKLLEERTPFLLWNGGCLLYVLAMTWQGWREGTNPSVLFSSDSLTEGAYLIRLASGLLIITANTVWIWKLVPQFFVETTFAIQPTVHAPIRRTGLSKPLEKHV
jgi:cytochrome c oxidase cbb3-type subunit I